MTHKTDLDKAFTRRAIVRYDAFRDIGGEQSASIALLDEHRLGPRDQHDPFARLARIYVKQLRRSVPDRALSPEEVDVVEAARNDRRAARRGRTGGSRPGRRAARQTGGLPRRPAAGARSRRTGRSANPARRPTTLAAERPREPRRDRRAPAVTPVAFLGPEGTFTEEALLAQHAGRRLPPVPLPFHTRGLKAVQAGEAPLGIVPIENSIEGSVVVTLDSLAFSFDDLHVVREVTWQVHQQLIARRALEFERVTKIVSIPHAYGQCRDFIREHLDGVEHEATDSTAEAVRRVSRVDRPWVAIGTRLAAEMYECVVVAADVEDAPDNRTRFVFVSRDEAPQDPATYKTSIVCGISQDQPGSLLMILREFAYRYVNLTKVESRPSKQGLGDYIFFIDMVGRATDPPIAQALSCLGCKLTWLKVLGSYPT